MEVFIRDEDKNKYESFALSGYYHTFRLGEEDTGKKNCLIQDFWSEDCEELPKLLVKSLDQHNLEIRAEERKKVCEELKSSQNKLAIEKLEDIKNYFSKIGADLIDDGQIHLIEIMIAELKGE